MDTPPNQPSAASVLGSTPGLDDLTGHDLLALLDRAAPWDSIDAFALDHTLVAI